MSRLVVAWTNEGGRSVLLADAIDASALFLPGASGASVLSRYLSASRRTFAEIRRSRPNVIVVQNPPIIAVLVCAFAAFLYRSSVLIDSHTGAFVDPKWRRFSWLHRVLSRRSAGLIVHNATQEHFVRGWADSTFQVGYVPFASDLERTNPSTADADWILVPASGAADEPLDSVRRAALQLPDMHFVITGSNERVESRFEGPVPSNVELTGYVSSSDYIDLIRAAPRVLALTTRPATLLSGAFEALALEVPLITSGTEELRNYFGSSAIFVDDTAASIVEGIEQADANQTRLAHAQSQVRAREDQIFADFLAFLDGLDQ